VSQPSVAVSRALSDDSLPLNHRRSLQDFLLRGGELMRVVSFLGMGTKGSRV